MDPRTWNAVLKAARTRGLEVRDCGQGHLQIVGGPLLCNFYPESKKRTAYIAGTTHRHTGVTPERAVEMCFEAPKPSAMARIDQRSKNSQARRNQVKRMRVRNGENCHWCGKPMLFRGHPKYLDLPELRATIEHVIPLSRGGLDNDNNRVLAHAQCNHARGSDMPELEG
ncbi:MAG: hypothetical protein B7Z80_08670 [Rhodospirillales bacterium 20-64-7]|nr:MAG: hypothetical protein B7Z80_08670 [Rhodospirillales bacterium 20-64-7]